VKPCFIKWLCEDIHELILHGHIGKINIASIDMLEDEVMSDLDVLCLAMKNQIVHYLDCTLIVTQECHMIEMKSIVFEGLTHS
jgi:hypothetical protein